MSSRLQPEILFSFIILVFLLWFHGGIHSSFAGSLDVPSFFSSVPKGYFAGVSEPCRSLSKARKSAVYDVVRQILGSISASYSYHSVQKISGDVKSPRIRFDDSLDGISRGVVLGVEKNIVRESWSQDSSGMYVYFVLVHYPENLIREMRRLSMGACLTAVLMKCGNDDMMIRISESNGVSVVLDSADVVVAKYNRFATAISYFVAHVPSGSDERYRIGIAPVKICKGSKVIHISASKRKGFYDYLLGAEVKGSVILSGHDEIGRHVEIKLAF